MVTVVWDCRRCNSPRSLVREADTQDLSCLICGYASYVGRGVSAYGTRSMMYSRSGSKKPLAPQPSSHHNPDPSPVALHWWGLIPLPTDFRLRNNKCRPFIQHLGLVQLHYHVETYPMSKVAVTSVQWPLGFSTSRKGRMKLLAIFGECTRLKLSHYTLAKALHSSGKSVADMEYLETITKKGER